MQNSGSCVLRHSLIRLMCKPLILRSGHLLNVLYLFQVVANASHVIHIVYIKLYSPFKDSVCGFNRQLADVDIQLARNDLSHLIQQPHAVDTFYIDGYEER